MHFYLTGPMAGLPLLNFPTFNSARTWLREQGHTVTCPAEMLVLAGADSTTDLEDQGFACEDLARFATEAILAADALAILPGPGCAACMADLEIAAALGVPVVLLDYNPAGGWLMVATESAIATSWLAGRPSLMEVPQEVPYF